MTVSYGRADGASASAARRRLDAITGLSWLPRAHRKPIQTGLKLTLAIAVSVGASLTVRASLSNDIHKDRAAFAVRASGGLSDLALAQLMGDAGPGAARFAAAHDPDAPHWAWKRPPGWARLDIDTPPTLNIGHLSMADAERINGVIPDSHTESLPVAPFVLRASAPERAQAVNCLAAAVYFEAALEPRAGQEAVAQVVLNRMRHGGFPKSVCGVVFQGSDRPGCQFSFACDGSMARPPVAWAWRNAKDVAERALNGHVMTQVGTATHYHTSWVMAWWTPTLVKVGRIGGHIFFRPTGPDGLPQAFTLAYGGGEARMSKVALIGKPQAAQPAVLIQASAQGSTLAPASVVIGGRTIALPGSTIYLNRVHGVVTDAAGQPTITITPMHAMIAMRAAAARAVRAADRDRAVAAAAVVQPTPNATAPAAPAPVANTDAAPAPRPAAG